MEPSKPVFEEPSLSARRRVVRRLVLAARNGSQLLTGLENKVMKMSTSDLRSSLYNYYQLLAPLLGEKHIS